MLRFLKISVVCCLVGMCITWPVLFPVNATGGGGQSQLDILNMSNVTNNYYRYFAHAGCAYLFYGFVLFMITRESIFYINLRQAYLLSPLYASRLSSRTVLFTSVPAPYLEEENIRRMLGPAVKRIWIASKTDDLDDLVKQRNKTAMKLEGAETKLIKTANGKRLKAEKKGHKGENTNGTAGSHDVESGSLVSQYLNPKDRPTHRLKPLIGKKVDTIDWCRAELEKLIPKVDDLQSKHIAHDSNKVGAIFVEFTTLAEAQAAYQSLTHHQVLHMAPRFTGMTTDEIIWKNLRIKWWERVLRSLVVLAFIVALVIFWSVPVAIVGAISNVKSLEQKYPSIFGWLSALPTVIFGVVSGLLPSVLLAVLMAILPIILRLAAKLSGAPTLSAVELKVQNYYFAFQVVDVFLVTTLGSSAASALGSIKGASGVTSLLASSLPKASDFYYSYFILQGLGVVSSMLLALSGLIIFMLLSKILDKTPRKLYKRWIKLAGLGWGTLFPIYETLFIIGEYTINILAVSSTLTINSTLLRHCRSFVACFCRNRTLLFLPRFPIQFAFRQQCKRGHQRKSLSTGPATSLCWALHL